MIRTRVRPTRRGAALGAVGVTCLVAGTLLGVLAVVQVGALLAGTVAAGAGWLVLAARAQERGGLRLVRHVEPHPVTVGVPAQVQVELHGGRGLATTQVSERAARELSGGGALRARVRRSPGVLALGYTVHPTRRGRWPVGPLEITRRDLFDVVRWRGPLGAPALVAVRPAVVPLDLTSGAAALAVDRAALGARTPSADDSALRGYRTGDDLRRVHWRSSARRGELVVRQDERAGRRPASVLLDLPLEDAEAEWTIRAGASIAVGLVHGGHHVRLLGGDVLGGADDHHRPDAGAVDALLDQTVDLRRPPDTATRDAWLATAVDTLSSHAEGAELVFALVGALDRAALTALARIGDADLGWAMVRGHGGDAARTLEALRRAGWTACGVEPGEDIAGAWQRLVDSDERSAVAR